MQINGSYIIWSYITDKLQRLVGKKDNISRKKSRIRKILFNKEAKAGWINSHIFLKCLETKVGTFHVVSHNPAVVIRNTIIRWMLGGVIAFLLVVFISPCFLSSLRVYEWSSELEDYVLKDGYVHRKRDEGWSRTRYGPYGFNSMAGMVDSSTSAIMIWGDSYVEAHQVSDEKKTGFQVNQILSEHGLSDIKAITVGRACWSVSDYYFKIPQYEKLINPVCHFIILAEYGLKDLCPDGETFISEPAPHFIARTLVDPHKSKVITDLYKWGLSDMLLAPWKAVRTVLMDGRNMRFSPGPCKNVDKTIPDFGCKVPFDISEPSSIIESWSYALDMLKTSTNKPIVLVLVPEVPYLERGKACCVDPQSEWRDRLLDLCRAKNIGCIDMTETLVEDYQKTGLFSRGFHNGRPDSGHLNARGHWLLSRVICTYLSKHKDSFRKMDYAVHTN